MEKCFSPSFLFPFSTLLRSVALDAVSPTLQQRRAASGERTTAAGGEERKVAVATRFAVAVQAHSCRESRRFVSLGASIAIDTYPLLCASAAHTDIFMVSCVVVRALTRCRFAPDIARARDVRRFCRHYCSPTLFLLPVASDIFALVRFPHLLSTEAQVRVTREA